MLRGWFPVEVLHFPLRSLEQAQRKASIYRSRDTRLHDAHRRLTAHSSKGGWQICIESWRSTTPPSTVASRAARPQSTPARDALRALAGAEGRGGLASSCFAAEVAYAVDGSALAEADAVRLQRRLDELRARVNCLEHRGSAPSLPRHEARHDAARPR